jgi:hypothetical protein
MPSTIMHVEPETYVDEVAAWVALKRLGARGETSDGLIG